MAEYVVRVYKDNALEWTYETDDPPEARSELTREGEDKAKREKAALLLGMNPDTPEWFHYVDGDAEAND